MLHVLPPCSSDSEEMNMLSGAYIVENEALDTSEGLDQSTLDSVKEGPEHSMAGFATKWCAKIKCACTRMEMVTFPEMLCDPFFPAHSNQFATFKLQVFLCNRNK